MNKKMDKVTDKVTNKVTNKVTDKVTNKVIDKVTNKEMDKAMDNPLICPRFYNIIHRRCSNQRLYVPPGTYAPYCQSCLFDKLLNDLYAEQGCSDGKNLSTEFPLIPNQLLLAKIEDIEKIIPFRDFAFSTQQLKDGSKKMVFTNPLLFGMVGLLDQQKILVVGRCRNSSEKLTGEIVPLTNLDKHAARMHGFCPGNTNSIY